MFLAQRRLCSLGSRAKPLKTVCSSKVLGVSTSACHQGCAVSRLPISLSTPGICRHPDGYFVRPQPETAISNWTHTPQPPPWHQHHHRYLSTTDHICLGFSLGSTVQAHTKGIWMWCVPNPQKPDHTLVLLDTEGLGDVEKNHLGRTYKNLSKCLKISPDFKTVKSSLDNQKKKQGGAQ